MPWIRPPALAVAFAVLLAPGAPRAADLASAPISHAAGFQSVTCHFVNAHPKKDLIVERFFIEDVNSSTGYGSATSGPCTGAPPWTVPPNRGCSRDLILVAACDEPNGCYCSVRVKGSAKAVRGRIIGTVTGSTATVSADLQ
jgi:hypothetical protein